MEIIEKIKDKSKDLYNKKSVTIGFLGDSVTQGCFECYKTGEKSLETVFDYKSAYSTRLKEILNILHPNCQINIINSGISGDGIERGALRIERDIISFNPDLVIVSYGLNDCMGGTIDNYENNLKIIIDKLKEKNIEMIFMTQNYMCDHISCHLNDKFFAELADDFSKVQNEGKLERYFEKAKKICIANNIKVCDMYSVWKNLHNSGVDTTELLANKLNHPIREMHYYMAIKLIECMFGI